MNKLIKAVGGPKIAILIAVVLAALVMFGVTVAGTGGGSGHGHDTEDHGHSHD
jgi:hypothetical protein